MLYHSYFFRFQFVNTKHKKEKKKENGKRDYIINIIENKCKYPCEFMKNQIIEDNNINIKSIENLYIMNIKEILQSEDSVVSKIISDSYFYSIYII